MLKYVTQDGLLQIVSEQPGTAVAIPAPTKGLAWLDLATAEPSLEGIVQPRASQSPKGFYFPASESVGRYGQASAATSAEPEPVALVGVRACELRARNYLDKVFSGGEFADPAWAARRDSTTIISCDCLQQTKSCFCTVVGGQPYPMEGYDVNLTPVAGGFVAEVATDKGREWLGEAGLPEATAEQLAERDRLRQQAVDQVRQQNTQFTFTAADDSQPKLPEGDEPSWGQFAADCVECGACTNICPTCHCFYLYDHAPEPEAFERVRTWDSCLLSTYHRMAGGVGLKLTPRPALSSRLANRVLHKFTYSPQQYGLLGCVGCGRCFDACLGEIDIRAVVQELGQ